MKVFISNHRSRIRFWQHLKICSLALFLFAFSASSTISSQDVSFVPMMQSATNESSTWITMLLPADADQKIQILSAQGEELSPSQVKDKKSPGGKIVLRKIFLKDLAPNTEYQVLITGIGGSIVDHRFFKTMEPKEHKLRIVLGSCMDHRRSDQTRGLWQRLMEDAPDVFLLMGDAVYVHPIRGNVISSVEEFWENYLAAWNSVEYFRLPRLIPTYVTWDDHDTGQNDTDENFTALPMAREVFLDFFGTEKIENNLQGPGVASMVSHSGFDFYLMDDRSWRTPNEENRAPPELETQWGMEQENWLIDRLGKSKNPAWLVNGSQFFGAYFPKESYENNHPVNFKKMQARIKGTNSHVIFASGDRHFSELMKIEPEILGYETFEITSSALQTKPFPMNPWILYKNPRHISGENKYNNYILVNADYDDEFIRLDIKAKSTDKVIFENQVKISRK